MATTSAPSLTAAQLSDLFDQARSSLVVRRSKTAVASKHKSKQDGILQAIKPKTTPGVAKPSSTTTSAAEELSVRTPKAVVKRSQATPDDAGAGWNHLPKTNTSDPKVKREFQLLRMRGILDSKQHFRKDTRKEPMPKFSAMGTLIEGPTEYYSARLSRRERKQTLVDEILSSHVSNAKFKRKYSEIQAKNSSGRTAHYKRSAAKRRGKG